MDKIQIEKAYVRIAEDYKDCDFRFEWLIQ